MRLSWDFTDTSALHVRKFLPFSPQFLVSLREAQRQDHRLLATEDDKSPTLIIAHWFQASQVFAAGAEDAVLFQWQREYETASGNKSFNTQLLKKCQQRTSYFSTQKSKCVYLQLRHRMNHGSASPGSEDWILRDFLSASETPAGQMFKEAFRTPAGAVSSRWFHCPFWAHTGISWLSGTIFPQTLNLKLDVTQCIRKGTGQAVRYPGLRCPLSRRNSDRPQNPLPGSSFLSPWTRTRN